MNQTSKRVFARVNRWTGSRGCSQEMSTTVPHTKSRLLLPGIVWKTSPGCAETRMLNPLESWQMNAFPKRVRPNGCVSWVWRDGRSFPRRNLKSTRKRRAGTYLTPTKYRNSARNQRLRRCPATALKGISESAWTSSRALQTGEGGYLAYGAPPKRFGALLDSKTREMRAILPVMLLAIVPWSSRILEFVCFLNLLPISSFSYKINL